jgi:hypothetical protein
MGHFSSHTSQVQKLWPVNWLFNCRRPKKMSAELSNRVARFFVVQLTKTGKYQITIIYTK